MTKPARVVPALFSCAVLGCATAAPQPMVQGQASTTYQEPAPAVTVVQAQPQVTAQPVMQPQPTAQAVYQPQPTAQAVYQPQPTAQAVYQPQPTAQAYPQTGANGSNFGTIAINTGFLPDPQSFNGTSGGATAASNLRGDCRGYIATRPDHLLALNTPFNYLRVETSSSSDTTLVIRGNGMLLCDDDSAGSRNARIASAFPAGMYEVWVGSYQQGQYAPYALSVSERPVSGNTGTTNVVATANTGVIPSSNYGAVQLSPGFVPDPAVVAGTSGGATPASNLRGDCRGWIASQPDHVFVAGGNFNYVRIETQSQSDTTLVVEGPNGWLCDDDSAGARNARVESAFPPGVYRVWIGSYQQGQNAPYRLQISELRR